MKRFSLFGLCLTLLLSIASLQAASVAICCPFCGGASQTFSQEMDSMDVVVIAKLIKLPPPLDPSNPTDGAENARAQFQIMEVLKGEKTDKLVEAKQIISTLYFGEGVLNKEFMIMAVRETPESKKLQWSTPLLLSERAKSYVHELPKVAKTGAARLVFFMQYLEDKDETLARDAYDEFANAPYADVKEIKTKLDRETLIKWISSSDHEDIPASRRRLYLTLLGVCGKPEDVAMLEGMLKSNDSKAKAGLDALVGCYLTLAGQDGLPLIEKLFIDNPKSEYADTYSAIMALRFHGTEGGVIPKEKIVKSVRLMLKRPALADLVIPDLARWQDWESMDDLVKLFKTADEKNSWVRVPVINFLRACPLPKAKEHLVELEKIDPAAVKRANLFFPGGGGDAPPPTDKSTSEVKPTEETPTKIATTPAPETKATTLTKTTASDEAKSPNLATMICVPVVIGLMLMGCQYSILKR